jgi:excisionase family DNA binding protein
MKTQPNSSPTLPIEETALQAIAQKMGAQISHVVCAAFVELLLMMKEEIKQAETSSQKFPPPTKSLLTAPDVAKALNVSKAQAYQLIRRKEIRSFSVGKLVRVRREDLDAFIQEHLVG